MFREKYSQPRDSCDGSAGKRGNEDLGIPNGKTIALLDHVNEAGLVRYLWQGPKCWQSAYKCDNTCHKNLTDEQGSIYIGPEDYTKMRHCLWVIIIIN